MELLTIIIAIVVLIIDNNNKSKEIGVLKKKLKEEGQNYCPNCGFLLHNAENITKSTDNKTKENEITKAETNDVVITEQPENNQVKAQPLKEKDIIEKKIRTEYSKNNAILITGSILIILSAITFLATTWNYTNNIFKIIILFFMFLTFEGISTIAKNRKLVQTSKAFHYLALAYLPIILFSFPALNLLGEFINNSVSRNIYFTLCALVLTFIYYIDSKSTNSKITMVSSIITSILSFLFFTAIFTTEINSFLLALFIYIMIICLLYCKNTFVFNKEIHLKTIEVLFLSSMAIFVYYSPISFFMSKPSVSTVVCSFVIIINSYIYLNKIKNQNEIYKAIFPLLTILAFTNISNHFEPFIIKQLIILFAIVAIYIYDVINNEKISMYTTYETLVFNIVLYIFTIFSKENYIIPTYLLAITQTSLIWLSYINSNEKTLTSLIGTAGILFSAFNIIYETNASMIILSFISFIIIGLGQIIKNKEIKNSFNIIGYAGYLLTSILYFEATIPQIISYLLFITLSFFNKLEKNSEYRIISYIFFNQLVFAILSTLNINNNNVFMLIIPFTTIIINLLELLIPKLKNNGNITYLVISYIISIIVLAINNSLIFNFIYLIIIDICYFIYIKDSELTNKEYQLPALLTIVPYIYSGVLIISNINYMYLVSALLITAMIYLSSKEKKPMYYIMFYVYAFTHIFAFDDINYIKYIILLIGTITIYLSEKKDLFKLIIYILIYLIYRQAINDLNLATVSILTKGSLLIMASLIIRDIFRKHFADYKVLIYCFYSFINLGAFMTYSSQPDAIIYLFFLTFLVMIYYNFKFGPELVVALITILINTFVLTKTFWTAIPWWIYILIIGTALVMFATNNEVNKEKEKNKEKLKKIKEHLDL